MLEPNNVTGLIRETMYILKIKSRNMKSFHSGFDNNVKSYSRPLKSANKNLPFYDNLVL